MTYRSSGERASANDESRVSELSGDHDPFEVVRRNIRTLKSQAAAGTPVDDGLINDMERMLEQLEAALTKSREQIRL